MLQAKFRAGCFPGACLMLAACRPFTQDNISWCQLGQLAMSLAKAVNSNA